MVVIHGRTMHRAPPSCIPLVTGPTFALKGEKKEKQNANKQEKQSKIKSRRSTSANSCSRRSIPTGSSGLRPRRKRRRSLRPWMRASTLPRWILLPTKTRLRKIQQPGLRRPSNNQNRTTQNKQKSNAKTTRKQNKTKAKQTTTQWHNSKTTTPLCAYKARYNIAHANAPREGEVCSMHSGRAHQNFHMNSTHANT